MDGAKNIDLSDIDIDYLINLDSEEENDVISFVNVAIVDIKNEKISIYESLYSNISDKLHYYSNTNIEIADNLGFIVRVSEEYPGWDSDFKSKLLNMYEKSYQKTHNMKSQLLVQYMLDLNEVF